MLAPTRIRIAMSLMLLTPLAAAGAEDGQPQVQTRVLIVVGPSDHPPGTHEVAAGGRVMKHGLEHATNLAGVAATVSIGWPEESAIKQAADTVVFIGDEFPPHQLPESEKIMAELTEMMHRGAGMVCIHFATGLREPDVGPDGDHPLLHWIGGYFASRCEHHQSVARVFRQATIEPAAEGHPVARGWQTFNLHDEPYMNNYFGPPGHAEEVGLIPIATSLLPPEQPERHLVAWGLQRDDGGRGFGIVMPHFYRNWQLDDLRTLILNGIVWTAGREVPEGGVRGELPDLATFQR